MKRATLTTALVILLFSGPAQAGHHSEDYREKRIKMMSERLELDDGQRSALRDIFEGQHQAMRQLRSETRGKIDDILTPEQQHAYQEMREERRSRWKEGRDGGR